MAPTLAKGDSIALQPSQSSSSSYTFDSAEAEADALLKQDDDDNKRQHGHHHNTHHTKLNMATTNDDDDSDSDEEHILDQELSQLTGTAPTTAAVTPAIKRIHPAPIIAIWILLSSSVILQNAWILGTRPGDLRFSYPVTLTAMHMTYATVGTRVLRYCTHLLDGLDNVDMTRDRLVSIRLARASLANLLERHCHFALLTDRPVLCVCRWMKNVNAPTTADHARARYCL